MDRLPRPVADWLALWRDLPGHPRQVLLNRSHQRGSTHVILAALLTNLAVAHPCTTAAAYTALLTLGPSSLIAVIGSAAHALWDRGLIWTDLDCQLCDPDDDGDNGDGDDPEPDRPDDDGDDLIHEITEYLRATACTTA